MSDSQKRSFSNNPYAPKIPHSLYFPEKADFVGVFVGSIFYGMVIALSFKCMAALFNPVYRRGEPIKWGFVSFTLAMFSIAIVGTAMNLNVLSISYIDNRGYPGAGGVIPPGPLGYRWLISTKALTIIPNLMFFLINWLGDGLLLYRCYVIYSKNLWVVAFPFLVYLGSVAMSIALMFEISQPPNISVWNTTAVDFGLPYYSISIALNVLLTLMIIIRLILHTRNVRNAVGIAGTSGLCKAIVTMLIESCALYNVGSLLVIGSWITGGRGTVIFFNILNQIQVIAPLLITQRVTDKSAFTSDTVVTGRLSSFKARSRGELTDGGVALPSGGPMSSASGNGRDSSEHGVGAETTISFHQDGV